MSNTQLHPDPPADDDEDDTPDPGFTPLTLTVSRASITGRPGTQHDITVTASATAQVGNAIFGEFLNAGGSASPRFKFRHLHEYPHATGRGRGIRSCREYGSHQKDSYR